MSLSESSHESLTLDLILIFTISQNINFTNKYKGWFSCLNCKGHILIY